jgi:putative endonuclease
MFYVYVIQNELSNKIYIGYTSDIEKRLDQHNDQHFILFGKNAFTKINKGNWVLVYKEAFETKVEALKREKALKSSRGRTFIHKQILGR